MHPSGPPVGNQSRCSPAQAFRKVNVFQQTRSSDHPAALGRKSGVGPLLLQYLLVHPSWQISQRGGCRHYLHRRADGLPSPGEGQGRPLPMTCLEPMPYPPRIVQNRNLPTLEKYSRSSDLQIQAIMAQSDSPVQDHPVLFVSAGRASCGRSPLLSGDPAKPATAPCRGRSVACRRPDRLSPEINAVFRVNHHRVSIGLWEGAAEQRHPDSGTFSSTQSEDLRLWPPIQP